VWNAEKKDSAAPFDYQFIISSHRFIIPCEARESINAYLAVVRTFHHTQSNNTFHRNLPALMAEGFHYHYSTRRNLCRAFNSHPFFAFLTRAGFKIHAYVMKPSSANCTLKMIMS
jgi:hypothetical protein